jgi:hypothetical protein
MTPAAIAAERPDMAPTGEFYLELAMTGAVVAAVPPYGRRQVAAFLRGVLARGPLVAGATYEPHRAILGALVYELEASAIGGALEEPENPTADLRDPGVVARERALMAETREWAGGERARRDEAYRARVDDILAVSDSAHGRAQERLDEAVREAEAFLAAGASVEADDAAALFA